MYKELKSFRFWCQKVLPLVYDNSLSYYEVLCKMVEYLNTMVDNMDEMHDLLVLYGTNIETLKTETAFLQGELEKIKNGEYVSEYINALSNWIDANLQQLVANIVTYVSFGLSADGRFVAYIPDTWDFLKFDTVIDPSNALWGHLVLQW